MNLALLGPPGAGKGTQAEWLSAEFGMTYISTGDLLRQHRQDATVLGRRAADHISRGGLVPDELVMEMIDDLVARCPSGPLLFDGVPRTVGQAESLARTLDSHALKLSAVLLIDAPDDVIEARIAGRVQCPGGHVYHLVHSPPGSPGVCDVDGDVLLRRDDDRPEVVRARLAVYESATAPVIGYYERLGLLHRADGAATPSAFRLSCGCTSRQWGRRRDSSWRRLAAQGIRRAMTADADDAWTRRASSWADNRASDAGDVGARE